MAKKIRKKVLQDPKQKINSIVQEQKEEIKPVESHEESPQNESPKEEPKEKVDFSGALKYLKEVSDISALVPKLSDDLQKIKEDIIQLVIMKGGKPATETDSPTKKINEKITSTSPTKVISEIDKGKIGEKKSSGMFDGLINIFNPKKILSLLGKIALPLMIVVSLWEGVTGAWEEWQQSGSIWEALKAGIGSITEFFTFGLIDKKMVSEFFDWGLKAIEEVMKSVADFFGFGDLFTEKFGELKKFMGVGVKKKILEVPIETPKQKQQNVDTSGLTKAVGGVDSIKGQEIQNEEYFKEIEKERTETARVKKEQEEKQYTGDDEIIRKRLGLSNKTETMKKEEADARGEVYVSKTPTRTPPEVKVPSTTPSKEANIPNISNDDKWIMDMIKKHEGVRTTPYKDSLGLWTVGVGHLIGDGKSLPPEYNREFTMAEVDAMFIKDFEEHKKAAEKIPGYKNANKATQGALIDLTFNMGASWYKKWPNFVKSLVAGNNKELVENLEGSKWYKQVAGRSKDIVALIKSGGDSTTPTIMTAKASLPPSKETEGKSGDITNVGGSLSTVITKQNAGVNLNDISKSLTDRVSKMASAFKEETGKKLTATSGVRTNEEQKKLWDTKLAENHADIKLTKEKVAEPSAPLGNGKGSLHASGLAIDINSKEANGLNTLAGTQNKSSGWLEKFGLTRPVKGEDWHVQLAGTQPVSDNPNNPGKPSLIAGKDDKNNDIKEEKIVVPEVSLTPNFGTQIAIESNTISSEQRQQQKPSIPIIINNTTNNNNKVVQNVSNNKKNYDDFSIWKRIFT
jgi:GH24 family phage-related lysozyme (muramidase)